MGIIGFIISMSTLNVAARYLALFLQAGAYAGFIVFYSWISTSFPRPPAKRAVAIALLNAFSNIGNIIGSYVWDLKENGYRKSYGTVLAMFGVTILGSYAFRMILVNLNKRIEARKTQQDVVEQPGHIESIDNADEAVNVKRGFRYLV